jgi:predicted DNA-binding protein
MKKGTPKTEEAVLVGTRIPPEVRDEFAELSRANSRSVAGELRVMIERRIAEVKAAA